MFYETEGTENVLRFYREYIKDTPEATGAFPAFQIAPPLPFIPEDRHGDMFAAIVACWAGPLDEGESQFKPFHDHSSMVILAGWDDPSADEANVQWVRDYSAAIAPHSQERVAK